MKNNNNILKEKQFKIVLEENNLLYKTQLFKTIRK